MKEEIFEKVVKYKEVNGLEFINCFVLSFIFNMLGITLMYFQKAIGGIFVMAIINLLFIIVGFSGRKVYWRKIK